jgi:hypothetical protein
MIPPFDPDDSEPQKILKPVKRPPLPPYLLKAKIRLILFYRKFIKRFVLFYAGGLILLMVLLFWPALRQLAFDIRKAPIVSPSAPLPLVQAPDVEIDPASIPGTEDYFTALIRKEPANPKWYFQRGLMRYEHLPPGGPVLAIEADFAAASRLSGGKDPAPIFYQGLVTGKAEDYTKALAVDPRYADALLYRGMDFLKSWNDLAFAGKEKEARPFAKKALADLNRAVELNPQSGPAHLGRGWAFFLMADFEKAHPDLADATELSPDNPHAWESFEACLEAEGLEEKAQECDRWALSLGGAVSRAQSIRTLMEKPEISAPGGSLSTPTASVHARLGKMKTFNVNVLPGFIVTFQSKRHGSGKNKGRVSLKGYLQDPPMSFTLASFKKKKADFGSFQSAVLSALAADKSGRIKKILESWHPDDREALKYHWEKPSERRKYLKMIKGVKTIQACGLVYSSHPLVLIRFNHKPKGGLVMALRYSEGRWLRTNVTAQTADFDRVSDVFLSGKGYGKGKGPSK